MPSAADHHKLPERVQLHHPVTGATIVVRNHLAAHYAERGWEPVDVDGAADDDVQVLDPDFDFEPAYIYDAERDDPGDLAAAASDDSSTEPAGTADEAGTQPDPGEPTTPDAQEG